MIFQNYTLILRSYCDLRVYSWMFFFLVSFRNKPFVVPKSGGHDVENSNRNGEVDVYGLGTYGDDDINALNGGITYMDGWSGWTHR